MSERTIRVTQDHIDRGLKMDACQCPTALALIEATGNTNPGAVVVSHNAFWLGAQKFITPPAVAEFIRKFDHNMTVEPFEFEIPETAVESR